VAGGEEAAEPRRVDPVVVTATKVETAASELGASVSVVPEEDFKTYHYLTLGTSLRSVPGVDIRQSGSFGKVTSISIRGASANQVQVLVDGVRVKSPTLGQVDLSDLSPDVIERVEVIRGPQSTLYGADAIGGVVNVITKRGRGPFTLSLEQTVGTDEAYISRGSLGGQWKALDYALGGSWASSGGQFPNDSASQAAVNGQIGLSLPWDSRVAFSVRWNRTETGLPVKFVCCGPLPDQPVIDPNAQQQSETLVMSLTGQTRPLPWWESRLRLSLYKNNSGFQDPVDPGVPFDFASESQIDVKRREAEWLNVFRVGPWSTTTVGLEYRDERGDNWNNFSPFSASYHVGSVFLEEQWRPIEGLFLTGGFRVEDNSVYGTDVTGRGGVSYAIKPWGTRVHASVGSGFRAPTLNDLFFPDFSNPDLQPERSLSWDVGVSQRLWRDRVRLGLTYFWNDFDNLIQTVPTAVFPFAAVVNVAHARSQGVELTAEVDVLPNLVASGSYTFTDTEDLDTGLPLPRQPRHRGFIGLTWEPLPRLSLFGQLYLVSQQFESVTAGYTAGYMRLDVGGTFRVVNGYGWLQGLDLTARIQNLLDANYAEVRGFPAPGIQAFLGLRATF
jgi:vitamin B12 transporter